MKTFLIGPVRGMPENFLEDHVKALEAEGWEVYWPARDTDQEDPTGVIICIDNSEAIREADQVHVVWDGLSQGSLFDLGMAFAMGKSLTALELPPATEYKSIVNMVRVWDEVSE